MVCYSYATSKKGVVAMAEQFMFPVLILSAYADMKWKKIPNLLLAAGGIGCFMVRFRFQGMDGILLAGMGSFLTILFFFPFFLIGGIGAGDVKLFALIAAMHGITRLLWVLMVLFVIASVCGIKKLIRQGVFGRRIKALLLYVIGRCHTGGLKQTGTCYDNTYTIILAPLTGLAYELTSFIQSIQ